MGCNCKKSLKKQSVQATQTQQAVEEARKAANVKKHIVYAAPSPADKK